MCSPDEFQNQERGSSKKNTDLPAEDPESVPKLRSKQSEEEPDKTQEPSESEAVLNNMWHGRLRPRKKKKGERSMMRTSSDKDREM